MKPDSANPIIYNDSAVEVRCNNDHSLLLIARNIKEGEIETVCRKCKQKRLIKFPVAIQVQA